MPGYCPQCAAPKKGEKAQASHTHWLLLMVLNAIIGICIWPAFFLIPLWLLGWIVSGAVYASGPTTCQECGTALLARAPQAQRREIEPGDAPPVEDAPRERSKLAQWAFPEDKPKRRKRRRR